MKINYATNAAECYSGRQSSCGADRSRGFADSVTCLIACWLVCGVVGGEGPTDAPSDHSSEFVVVLIIVYSTSVA